MINIFIELTDDYLCILGVYPNERITPQNIHSHLRYEVKAPSDDTIEHAIDYTQVRAHMRQIVLSNQFHLIETLAQTLLNSLFQAYPFISATLRLTKQECRSTVEVSR